MASFFRWALREMRIGMGRAALSGPERQESLDLMRALDFVSARAPSSSSSLSSSSSWSSSPALLSLPKQRELVHAEILAQVTQVLRAVAEANASEPARRRLKRLHPDGATVPDPKLFPLNTPAHGRGARDAEGASGEFLEELKRLLGFSIRCAASGAPDNAGRGVWLGGAAPTGSVVRLLDIRFSASCSPDSHSASPMAAQVAIFPGVVYLPGHLLRAEGSLEALEPDVSQPHDDDDQHHRHGRVALMPSHACVSGWVSRAPLAGPPLSILSLRRRPLGRSRCDALATLALRSA